MSKLEKKLSEGLDELKLQGTLRRTLIQKAYSSLAYCSGHPIIDY